MNVRLAALRPVIAMATALVPLTLVRCASQEPATFDAPEAAVTALLDAADDPGRADELLGPGGHELLAGDEGATADPDDLARVRDLADERMVFVEGHEPGRHVALLGEEEWPLPLPLVREDGDWRFDVEAGRRNLLCRRIGANELDTLDVLREIVDAQVAWLAEQPPSEPPAYEPGFVVETDDGGIFWNAAYTTSESEVVPPTASEPLAARSEVPEVIALDEPVAGPLNGYLFRVLPAQGPHACGGERSYLDDDGRMTGGFALLAWPQRYGETGIMTFQIDRSGIPYEKDLGEQTATAAADIATFDPDPTWMPVAD